MISQIITAGGPMINRIGNGSIQKSIKNAKDITSLVNEKPTKQKVMSLGLNSQ